eukprot:m.23841 g.23841  ORF g.23841 m.23841 type:complete len:223 (-) comp11438_c0_seq1:59-727(-)
MMATTLPEVVTFGSESNGPKVLCLHGWRTSAAIFKFQARDFPKNAQFHFVNGPLAAQGPAQAIVEQFFSKPYFEWYTTTPKGTSPDLDAALAYLSKLNKEYGPYHGIAGFSQGGRLAAMVASMAARDLPNAPLPDLKFAVILSAATASRQLKETYFPQDTVLPMPAFFSHGVDDFCIDSSNNLSNRFLDPVVTQHVGAHEVCNKSNGSDALDQLATFIQEHS